MIRSRLPKHQRMRTGVRDRFVTYASNNPGEPAALLCNLSRAVYTSVIRSWPSVGFHSAGGSDLQAEPNITSGVVEALRAFETRAEGRAGDGCTRPRSPADLYASAQS